MEIAVLSILAVLGLTVLIAFPVAFIVVLVEGIW